MQVTGTHDNSPSIQFVRISELVGNFVRILELGIPEVTEFTGWTIDKGWVVLAALAGCQDAQAGDVRMTDLLNADVND